MNPDTVAGLQALAKAGLDVILLAFVGVLWKVIQAKDGVIADLQQSRLDQVKEDADRLLAERTVVLPLVERSTDALARTTEQLSKATDQLAVTTSVIAGQRQELSQQRAPSGNG